MAAGAIARERGIRPGLSLAEARALCPNVVSVEHDPRRDAQALEGLARWMMRFTPVVSVGYEREEPDEAEIESREIFLDVTGCQRLFGGLEKLVERVSKAMDRFKLKASLAIAPTAGAAWALAFGRMTNFQLSICSSQFEMHCKLTIENLKLQIEALLAPLPVAALRLEPDTLEALYHLGLSTIGQVMSLPRSSLPSRFGPALLRRIHQALGNIPEPLTPLVFQSPIEARMDWEGAVESLEAIWLVFQKLVERIIEELAHRGCGARQLDIQLFRPYAPAIEKTIHLSQASRNAAKLFNLFRCALEGSGFARSGSGEGGFVGMQLRVSRWERISDEQIWLLEQEEHEGRVELIQLIERLRVRLGEEAVVQAESVESHLPERAFCLESREEPPRSRMNYKVQSENCQLQIGRRPLHLLSCPREVRAIVSPSDDRDGRPVSFTHEGQVHRLSHSVGPERIGGIWWEGHARTRDYFEVENALGRRFWIFRVVQTGKWYLHGTFE